MSKVEITRTWTATIEVRVQGRMTVLDATTSRWDLLRDQTVEAVREASCFLPDHDVTVVLWKTTRARGTERDRSFRPFLDRRGVLRYDGPYC